MLQNIGNVKYINSLFLLITFLKEINLESKKKFLLDEGSRIADSQRQSKENRKKLAEQTKGN